jgi:hypothetical protein
MTNPPTKEAAAKYTSRPIWVVVLAIVFLTLVLIFYDHGAVKHYGRHVYASAAQVKNKVSGWAKETYTCGFPGCGPKLDSVATAPVQTEPAMTSTGDTSVIASPNSEADSATSSGAADNTATDTTHTPPSGDSNLATGATSASGATGTVNFPAYPPYPNYPAYPPDSSFGHQGANADSGSANRLSSETPTTPSPGAPGMPQAAQPAAAPQAPVTPPKPPKPQAAPGNPEYPEYPSYPSYPSAIKPPTNSAPPSQFVFPSQPRTLKPDGRPSGRTLEPSDLEGLYQARLSAQKGNLDAAVREYQRYLAAHPNDIDAFGELGNVFLQIRRFPDAAQNYYEAATRLIDAGQIQAVRPLMPVIQAHEPMLATLLNKKLTHVSGGEPGYRR